MAEAYRPDPPSPTCVNFVYFCSSTFHCPTIPRLSHCLIVMALITTPLSYCPRTFPLSHHFPTVPLSYCTYHCSTIPLFYCLTVLMPHCPTVLLSCCPTVPAHFYCPTSYVSLFHSTAPLPYCSIVLLSQHISNAPLSYVSLSDCLNISLSHYHIAPVIPPMSHCPFMLLHHITNDVTHDLLHGKWTVCLTVIMTYYTASEPSVSLSWHLSLLHCPTVPELFHYPTTFPLYHYHIAPITATLSHCSTVSPFYCPTALLFYCPTVPLSQHISTVPHHMSHCFIPLPHCPTVLLSYCPSTFLMPHYHMSHCLTVSISHCPTIILHLSFLQCPTVPLCCYIISLMT